MQSTNRLAIQLLSLLARLNPHTCAEASIPPTSLYGHTDRDFADPDSLAADPFFKSLNRIVYRTGTLNHRIRQTPDIIFYWVPVHKGMEFEIERMTCANLRPVQEGSPLHDEHAVVDPAIKATVRVVCFHGLTTYKRGRGDLGRYMLERESREDYFEPGGAA